MTYNVFSGTLNPAQSTLQRSCACLHFNGCGQLLHNSLELILLMLYRPQSPYHIASCLVPIKYRRVSGPELR